MEAMGRLSHQAIPACAGMTRWVTRIFKLPQDLAVTMRGELN